MKRNFFFVGNFASCEPLRSFEADAKVFEMVDGFIVELKFWVRIASSHALCLK